MNPLRILTIALVGLAATRTSAAPVLFRLEADPFTNWEITLRDPGGMIMSMNVGDTDGDGMHSFTTEDDHDVVWHEIRTQALWGLRYRGLLGIDIPFFATVAGDPLIVDWPDGISSIGMVSLGEDIPFELVSQHFDPAPRVHIDPGIPTALDLLATDVNSLPTYTGVAEVVGLMTVQVIPEPSSTVLAILTALGFGFVARSERSGKKFS